MPALTEAVANRYALGAFTTLGASGNTFTYRPKAGQWIIFYNSTGGALTPTIIGDAATNVPVDGAGLKTVSTGFALSSIAAGASAVAYLDDLYAYLVGNLDITGASGLSAILVGP